MLHITGEYIITKDPGVKPTRRERILSFLWPVTVTSELEGADWIQVHYLDRVYKLRFNRLTEVRVRHVRSVEYDDMQKYRDQGCTKPPAGWWCSREPSHDGPCAARQIGAENRAS